MDIQKTIQYFFKAFFQGIVISLVIFCVIIGIEYTFGRTLNLNNDLLVEIGYYCVYGIILSTVNGAYFDYINKKVNWIKYSKYRFLISSLGSVILTIIAVFFIRIITEIFIYKVSFNQFIKNEKIGFYLITLLITIIISLFFNLI